MSSVQHKVVTVPAREARAVAVATGQNFTVRDVAGGQVGDLFALNASDPDEVLSASHTRAFNRRLFPSIGEPFVTTRRRPILTLMEDTSPGVHDMLIPACDPERYRLLGAEPAHRSCATNLVAALRPWQIALPYVPQPVNVFMNTPPQPDGTIVWLRSPSNAGDAISFRAEQDIIVVLSSCPMDVIGISRGELTPLAIELSV